MSNIISYLRWRGDLRFSERPFNEVDNLVLSALSYLDFEGIVPECGQNKYVTISEAAVFFFNISQTILRHFTNNRVVK